MDVTRELGHLQVPLGKYGGQYHGLRVGDAIEYVTSAQPSADWPTRSPGYCWVSGFREEPRALCVVHCGGELVQLDVDLARRAWVEVERKWTLETRENDVSAVVWDYDTPGDPLTPFSRIIGVAWSEKELADALDERFVVRNLLVSIMPGTLLSLSTVGRSIIVRRPGYVRPSNITLVENWRSLSTTAASVVQSGKGTGHERIVCYRNYIARRTMTYVFSTSRIVVLSPWKDF